MLAGDIIYGIQRLKIDRMQGRPLWRHQVRRGKNKSPRHGCPPAIQLRIRQRMSQGDGRGRRPDADRRRGLLDPKRLRGAALIIQIADHRRNRINARVGGRCRVAVVRFIDDQARRYRHCGGHLGGAIVVLVQIIQRDRRVGLGDNEVIRGATNIVAVIDERDHFVKAGIGRGVRIARISDRQRHPGRAGKEIHRPGRAIIGLVQLAIVHTH